VMAQELSRRTAAERAPRATRTRAVSSRRAAAGRRARTTSKPAAVEVQTSFETLLTTSTPTVVVPTDSAATTADTSVASVAPAPATQPPGKRGRLAWTRDRVVEELANWLMQDPVIDAATLSRRGQSSLVAAARRLFGRFDAALNAANLHLAELYPDGPPKRGRMSAAA
jgi:hypothetical protein